MLNINNKLKEMQNQLETRQNLGQEVNVLDIVNEMVSPRKSRKGARKEKNKDKLAEGARVLEDLSRSGIKLPSSMDKLLRGKKPVKNDLDEAEEKDDVENLD